MKIQLAGPLSLRLSMALDRPVKHDMAMTGEASMSFLISASQSSITLSYFGYHKRGMHRSH